MSLFRPKNQVDPKLVHLVDQHHEIVTWAVSVLLRSE
jgi:hypothetical protein